MFLDLSGPLYAKMYATLSSLLSAVQFNIQLYTQIVADREIHPGVTLRGGFVDHRRGSLHLCKTDTRRYVILETRDFGPRRSRLTARSRAGLTLEYPCLGAFQVALRRPHFARTIRSVADRLVPSK